MSAGRIESVRIRGFRSLADIALSNLRNATVLIGANGSGKSTVIRSRLMNVIDAGKNTL